MRAHLRSWSLGRRSSSGFTLVEMLVTLVIFAVVAVTLTLVVMNSAKSKQRTTQRIESEQGARAAVDLMARDIRSAGYGADRDFAPNQPAIAYVDSKEILISEDQSPYPDNSPATSSPQAYNPAGSPKPFPLNATAWTPPTKYASGAELIRYTLDVNNDGVVDANDVASAQGADAAATPNPNDYVLVRQVYGDNTSGTIGNNGGTTERVALVRRPGDTGVPPMFNVYMKGFSTPYDWSNGPVPANQLQNIASIQLQVTATASKPDNRGQFAQTTIATQVNASRSVPSFSTQTLQVSGYVFNDLNTNRVKDGSDVGIPGATVRMGSFTSFTNASGYYQINAPAGSYTIRHTPAMGYGSFAYPDTFNVQLVTASLQQSFADTARQGGVVPIYAYDDRNGNSIQDTGELGVQGMKFSVTPGTPETPSGVTDGSGALSLFTGVGGYSVTCIKPDSVTVTEHSNDTGTMTNGGSGVTTARFGIYNQQLGHITGKVFVDANRNGNFDSGELGMGSVWVGVTKDGGINVIAYGYTDANGNYDIPTPINDPPHTDAYSVYTIPPNGYFPTTSMSVGNLWLKTNPTLQNNNFGMANYQIITLNASRVLSLAAADLIEKDWNGGHTDQAIHDADLILGADAGGSDNISVWFNQYPGQKMFNASADYSRLAPNSVMSMVVDTLDKQGDNTRPDVVTGTKFTSGGNFFVWFTQGTSGNEGYLPTNYSSGQNYRTQDNGDVQAVATLDCGGGDMPDIIVGTKGATAGQGSIEVWVSSNQNTPSFTRDETFTLIGGSIMGEVTGITLADLDNDGDKDMIVCTRTSDFNGQLGVFENRGRTAGSRFYLRYSVSFGGSAPTCVCTVDADGDGWKDIFVGTQRSTAAGNVWQIRNTGLSTLWSFSIIRAIDAGGIVQALSSGDYGGATRGDLAVGTRSTSTGFAGGVRIYYLDTGIINSGTDPSAGTVVNMVPALASGNFNFGLNSTSPPTPYLTDLAAGVKISATTGALYVFVR
ncbi:MAG TPA: prepilin-type N-terminal cleavage/methylation domain-containing protein [Verrucomicrobiae bacterium]|nr:prepilin-type N-terminal cleavage/methylation domain-containing protein [Verrucomicrobiae bacterium]